MLRGLSCVVTVSNKLCPATRKAASMDHATSSRLLLATHFATSLLPLTARLVPAITEIGRLVVSFRRADPAPRDCHRFETRLQEALRELGRIIVEWTFNHLEPHDRKDLPGQIESGGTWYRRRSKTPNRSVATLFGTITLWRMLYQDVHGVEPSIFPLEIRLGLESGRATPALAERVGEAGVVYSPQTGVAPRSCGAVVGRDLAGGDRRGGRGDGSPSPRRPGGPPARVAGAGGPVLGRPQAGPVRGSRRADVADPRPGVLPGRGHGDGVGLRPARTAVGDGLPREDARAGSGDLVAAIDGLDRGGAARLGRAIAAVGLHHRWGEPPDPLLPSGAPADERPHHPGRRLKWHWVIDYYHACGYITKLSEALFADARAGASWARRMRRWLKEKPRGIYRVLHSAAALRRRRIIASAAKRDLYRTAYAYLRKRMRWLDYRGYRRDHLPIGSGVTEAACKTVFTQRLKQSGMTWKVESGQWIVDLRVVHLSGVWSEVYQSYLGSKTTLQMGTQGTTAKRKTSNAA
jgi:hypothetical protein